MAFRRKNTRYSAAPRARRVRSKSYGRKSVRSGGGGQTIRLVIEHVQGVAPPGLGETFSPTPTLPKKAKF